MYAQDESASSSGGNESMQDRLTSSGSGTIVSEEEQEDDDGEDDEQEEEEASEAGSMSYDYDESYANTSTPTVSQSRTSAANSNVRPSPPPLRPSSMSNKTESVTTIASTYYEDDDDEDAGHRDTSADAYHNNHRHQNRPSNNKDSRFTTSSMSYTAAGKNSSSYFSSTPRTSPDSRAYRSVSAAVMRRMKPSTSSVSTTMPKVDTNQNQQTAAVKRTQSAHVVNMPAETAKRKPQSSSAEQAKQPNATNAAHGAVQPRDSHNILPEVAQRRTFYDFMHFDGGVMKHDCTTEEFFLAGDYPQTWDELHDLLRNTQSRLEEDFCDRLQALVDELTSRPELLRRNSSAVSDAAENAGSSSPVAAGVSPELVKMFSQTALDAVNYMHYQFQHVHDQFERFRNDTRNEIQGLIQEHIKQQVVMQQQLDENGKEISRLAQLPRSLGTTPAAKHRPSASPNPGQPPSSSSYRRVAPTSSARRLRPSTTRLDASSPSARRRHTKTEEEPPSPLRTSEVSNDAVIIVPPYFERLFGRNVRRLLQRIVSNPQNLLHLFCFSMLLLCMAVLAATNNNNPRVLVPSTTPQTPLPPPAPSFSYSYPKSTPSSSSYYHPVAVGVTTAGQSSRWVSSIKSMVCRILPRRTPFCRSEAAAASSLPFIDRNALDSYNSYYSSGSYSTSENSLHSAGIAQQEQYYKDKMQHPPSSSEPPYVSEYNAMGTPPHNRPTPMDVLNNYF